MQLTSTKHLLSLLLFFAHFHLFAQPANCDNYCVTNIEMDSINPNMLLITIYNGDSFHINYPYLDFILDSNGDTIANTDLSGGFFAHLGYSNQTYMVGTTLDSVPSGFIATVVLAYYNFSGNGSDTVCILPYPCNMTGVEDISVSSSIVEVYPNPTTQFASILFENTTQEKYHLRLYNAQGSVVLTVQNIVGSQVELDLKNLAVGLYFFELQSGKNRATGRILKQ